MTSCRLTIASCLALVIASCPPVGSAQDQSVLRGRVTDVHDGDTIKVNLSSGPISVRLHGVDAPELKQTHGEQSRRALLKLVGAKTVDLDPTGQSSYDRMVAIVYVGDINVNEALLKSGEVWAARKYLRKREDAAWCAYENTAREWKVGLWSQPTIDWIDPGDWRKRKELHYKYQDYSKETTARCIAAIAKH